jgi:hypothetical protein
MIDNLISTAINEYSNTPVMYFLYQNYPNPFNPKTNIRFEIAKPQKLNLKIFNNQGRFVRSLLNNSMKTGRHELSWDGLDERGNPVSSGIYFYILQGAEFKQVRKMMLLR